MRILTVGRGSDCDVIISDPKVSRVHVQIIVNDQGLYSVVDLGSSNGTFVNGKQIINETRLSDSDQLRIGDTVLPWKTYFLSKNHQKKRVHKIWLWGGASFTVILFLLAFWGGTRYREKQEVLKMKQHVESEMRSEQVKAFKAKRDSTEQSYVEALESRDSASMEYAKRMELIATEYENRASKAEEAHKKEFNSRVKAEKERDLIRKEAEGNAIKTRKQLEIEKAERIKVQKDLSKKERELEDTKVRLLSVLKEEYKLTIVQMTSKQIASVLFDLGVEGRIQKLDPNGSLDEIFNDAYVSHDFGKMQTILSSMKRAISGTKEKQAEADSVYVISNGI